MTSDSTSFAILLDPATPPATTRLDLPAGAGPVEAAEALEALLMQQPAVDRVLIALDGRPVGTTSRAHLARLADTIRGDADGASLPGESTRYRLFHFRCPACPADDWRIELDGTTPTCPDGHGPMDAQP
jgi:hypothetical protein